MAIRKLAKPFLPPDAVEFSASGLGRLRSTGEIMVLFLHLENPQDRAAILAEACRALHLDPQAIVDEFHDTMCSNCGMSVLMHKDNGGSCF